MDGYLQASVVLFSLLTQSLLTSRVFKEATMGITGSARTLPIIQCSEAVSPVRSEHDLCRSVPRPATKFLTQAARQSGRFDLTGLRISGGRWCY